MWLAILTCAYGAEAQLRIEQSVGWMFGEYTGDTRASVDGLPIATRVAFGAVGQHVGGGLSIGGQLLPWWRVRTDADTFRLQNTLTLTPDTWLHVYPGDAGWFVCGRLGVRWPFEMRSRIHRNQATSFVGANGGLGAGFDSPVGDRGWGWSARAELEAQAFGQGTASVRMLVPTAAFAVTQGGRR